MSCEIKDIMDQISEGGRSIHEIDKIRKRLEAEKLELETALSEAEGALEQEENKVLRASLEINEVKKEIDRRISQKEDEFNSTKKNFLKAIEAMQAAVESETKSKVEALRMKKKLDTDVVDLGVALEHANAANAESQHQIKMLQNNIRAVQSRLEEESRAKAMGQDNIISANQRCNANQNALEEGRSLLEQADKNRRMVEQVLYSYVFSLTLYVVSEYCLNSPVSLATMLQELADENEKLSDLTCQNQAIHGAKIKCEQEMSLMSHDLDEMQAEAAMSEEKATRAMVDVVRLAEELRNEQDCAMSLERDKKLLEAQARL